jgi:Ca-activated chloride channel family protein
MSARPRRLLRLLPALLVVAALVFLVIAVMLPVAMQNSAGMSTFSRTGSGLGDGGSAIQPHTDKLATSPNNLNVARSDNGQPAAYPTAAAAAAGGDPAMLAVPFEYSQKAGANGNSFVVNPAPPVPASGPPAIAAQADNAPVAQATATTASGGAVEPAYTPDVQPVASSPFVSTGQDHLSTFALDVDTGSYVAARNYLNSGTLPPPGTVRVEEFVNYFRYDYSVPEGDTFGISVDAAPSPFNAGKTQIVRVGIQGQRIDNSQRKDAVLTFVIDVSGSMAEPRRLPLVKQALRLLVNELRDNDQVAIVVYGDAARQVLDYTSGSERGRIMQAIDTLQNEGSTNTEDGLRTGYRLASGHLKQGSINRVILCSDGVANVGATSPEGIRGSIKDYTKQGITLTTVGFGMGDYNDHLMEQLADDGDGNYAYVDTLAEAQRIFVENVGGTLQVIAKDAKVQVDFNPNIVSRYRLIGYENRDVADSDFRNDQVDAGEVGAGHSVTALYEVELANDKSVGTGTAPALTVQLRYADPKNAQVREIKRPFNRADFGNDFTKATVRFQLAVAVAGFAEELRDNGYGLNGYALSDVDAISQRLGTRLVKDKDVQDFVQMVQHAAQLAK